MKPLMDHVHIIETMEFLTFQAVRRQAGQAPIPPNFPHAQRLEAIIQAAAAQRQVAAGRGMMPAAAVLQPSSQPPAALVAPAARPLLLFRSVVHLFIF